MGVCHLKKNGVERRCKYYCSKGIPLLSACLTQAGNPIDLSRVVEFEGPWCAVVGLEVSP
jgi:hypothetical protein